MSRWKPWHFGAMARRLPVCREARAWAETHVGRRVEDTTSARRHPSHAVPETLQAVLDHPSRFLVRRRREWDLLKYSRLYTGEFYPVGAVFEFVVRDAWLHVPSGFVISPDREVLGFSSHALPSLYEAHSPCPLEDAPWVEEPAFKVSTAWGNNYAHWLMDGLPKAVFAGAGPERLVVADRPSPRFQKESLALLGLHRVLAPETELLRFRELRFVSGGRSGVPHPQPLLRLRELLRAVAGPATGPRRIYISRQHERRRITNESQVHAVLTSFGFEEVFSEQMDFAAQVRLFSGAEAIFGAHGAGTMNVLFAPPGAALIEAFNPRVWDHAAHRIASLCGVRHYHLFGENASKGFDMSVDPRVLEKTLALALDCPSQPRPLLIEEKY